MAARQAKVAFSAFLVLSIGITANAFFLQSDPAAIAAARANAQRAAAKAELARVRRLSVDAVDVRPARAGGGGVRPVRLIGERIRDKSLTRRTARIRYDAAKLPAATLQLEQVRDQNRQTVKAIQRELKRRGYEPGYADGVPGLVTRAAIMAFEHDQGAALTGEPGAALLRRIVLGQNRNPVARQTALPAGSKRQAERIIRTVQRSLKALGYQPGEADGISGEATLRAIREFELDQGMAPKGRVSGRLVARLARVARRGRLASRGK